MGLDGAADAADGGLQLGDAPPGRPGRELRGRTEEPSATATGSSANRGDVGLPATSDPHTCR